MPTTRRHSTMSRSRGSSRRGFAAMSPEQRRAIASKGGRARRSS